MVKKTDKLEKILNEMNIDGIFLTDLYNLRYFTGFTGTTGVAFVTKKGNFFFSDFRYKNQCSKQVVPMGFEFVEIKRGSIVAVGEYAKKLGINKVGFEDKNVSFSLYNTLKDIFNAELVPVGDRIILERMVKTPDEIEKIKKEGVSEKEVAGYLEYIQRKLGAENRSFDTIVASGHRSSLPHGVASNKKIEKDEFITMDYGAYYDGYVSDITRTVYYGSNISDRHRKVYNSVLEAQLLGVSTVKAGMMSDDVDTVVRDFLKERGYVEEFGHGLGHGIGLEIHELPYLSGMSHIELKENMLVTVEPGLYFDGWGGVRIEDDVIVTKDGCEILNNSSKELIIIE